MLLAPYLSMEEEQQERQGRMRYKYFIVLFICM
jgi:hypothetical protein